MVEPHITATKTVSDATPHLGDTITYTLVLTNDGTSDAFGVVLAELLPAGVTLTSLTSTTPAGGATVLTATSITGGGAGLAGVYDIPVGATVTIVYEAQVSADPAIVGGLFGGADDTLTGTVSVTWTSLDGTVTGERTGTDGEGPDATVLNNYANTTQWSVTVVGADLALVKDDALASVSPGDTWTYTLTVSNNGTDTATGVVLTESIPAEIALGTVLVNGVAVTVTPVAGGFTVALPDIAAGAAVTVEVEVTLAAAVSVGYEQFTNTASVTHDDVEPTVTDNTDDDTNLIDAAPAIGVVKEVTAVNGGAVPLNSLGQPVIAPGDTLIYRIVVTNTGDQHALVNILDTFPGVTLDLSTVTIDDAATGVTAVIDLASGTIAWNGVSLDAGQTIVITIEAEALDPQLQAIDNFTNTVVVTNLNPNNPAEDGVEARDDALVDLDAFPDLVVTKVNSTDRIGLDDTFTYTITLSNRGDQNATGVTVVDTLPPHVEFLGASGNYTWDPVARTITWTSADNPGLQTVEGRGAETLTFTVTVKLPINSIVFGDLTNTVRAFDDGANGPDINPPDNEASVTTGVLGFLYDSFQNYSLFERGGDDDWHRLGLPIEIYHDAILPIAPIYSGAAEPGSTLEVVLYNANGDVIGRQTVMVDTGGGWMASFPGAIVKDYPQSVVITQTPPANQAGGGHGYNLRPYYATAINAGHFFKENLNVTRLSEQTAESSGSALAEANGNPVGFDPGSGVYETLALPGHPTGR